MHEHVTLKSPDPGDSAARGISSGFPADLLAQSAGRLRVLALLYAFVFFMAGILPVLLFPADRGQFFATFLHWRVESRESRVERQRPIADSGHQRPMADSRQPTADSR